MRQSPIPISEKGLIWLDLPAFVISPLNPPALPAPFISFYYFLPTTPADNIDAAFILLLCHCCSIFGGQMCALLKAGEQSEREGAHTEGLMLLMSPNYLPEFPFPSHHCHDILVLK